MKEGIDSTAYNNEQGNRARKLFAAVVLAALDDAIADDKKFGNGPDQIARWARSKDGREVLTCAGIDPNERVVEGLMSFVSKGVRTSVALSREESERRHAAEEEAVLYLAMLKRKEWLPETGSNGKSVVFDLSIYSLKLFHDVWVVFGEVADPAEILQRLLALPLAQTPSG